MHPRTVLAALLLGACAHPPASPPAAATPSPRYATPPASVIWTQTMKVGRCAGIAQIAETKAAGYEYVELGVQAVAKLTDEEFGKAVATHAAAGVPTPVANSFLPPELKVTGAEIDEAKQMAYVTKAFDRMARLGVKIIVFGSGGARRVPDGFPRQEAWAQLVEFAKRIATEAAKRNIVLAVEPLRQQETNIINTAAEGLRWVQAVDHPHFQLMVDFYHLAVEKEDPDILLSARPHIVHFHFANPNGRVYPKDPAEYDYAKFFASLRKGGYHTGISMEAGTKNFPEEGPVALSFLKAQLGGDAATAAGK